MSTASVDHIGSLRCTAVAPSVSENQRPVAASHALFSPEPEVFHMQPERKWKRLEVVVDSGAAVSVAPEGMVPWVQTQPSAGSQKGPTYVSASRDKLPN